MLIQLEELAILPNNCEISSDKIVFQKVQIIMLLYPNVECMVASARDSGTRSHF